MFCTFLRASKHLCRVPKTETLYLFCKFTSQENMKILNVAEKNDAAKNIAAFLSGGRAFKVSSHLVLYF